MPSPAHHRDPRHPSRPRPRSSRASPKPAACDADVAGLARCSGYRRVAHGRGRGGKTARRGNSPPAICGNDRGAVHERYARLAPAGGAARRTAPQWTDPRCPPRDVATRQEAIDSGTSAEEMARSGERPTPRRGRRWPRRPAPIAVAAAASSSARTERVDGQRHQRLAAGLAPGHLHGGDVDAGLAEQRADRADDAGAVGVAEEQQDARRRRGRASKPSTSVSLPMSRGTGHVACRTTRHVPAVGSAPRTVTRLRWSSVSGERRSGRPRRRGRRPAAAR